MVLCMDNFDPHFDPTAGKPLAIAGGSGSAWDDEDAEGGRQPRRKSSHTQTGGENQADAVAQSWAGAVAQLSASHGAALSTGGPSPLFGSASEAVESPGESHMLVARGQASWDAVTRLVNRGEASCDAVAPLSATHKATLASGGSSPLYGASRFVTRPPEGGVGGIPFGGGLGPSATPPASAGGYAGSLVYTNTLGIPYWESPGICKAESDLHATLEGQLSPATEQRLLDALASGAPHQQEQAMIQTPPNVWPPGHQRGFSTPLSEEAMAALYNLFNMSPGTPGTLQYLLSISPATLALMAESAGGVAGAAEELPVGMEVEPHDPSPVGMVPSPVGMEVEPHDPSPELVA